MTKRYFQIYKQESPLSSKPFRLVETNFTSDGMRSRLCNGDYETLEEAQEALRKKESST